MPHREAASFAVTQQNVIGLSVLCLVMAGILGLFNSHKVKGLRADVVNATAARDAAQHRRIGEPQRSRGTGETAATGGEGKVEEAENKAAKAEEKIGQWKKAKAE